MLNFFSGSDFNVVAWLVGPLIFWLGCLIFDPLPSILCAISSENVHFQITFFANLNHSNLLNGRIDLFLADDLIATNCNCNLIEVPKLNHRLVISGTKKGPEIANFRASLTGRLHVLVDARWTGSTRGGVRGFTENSATHHSNIKFKD